MFCIDEKTFRVKSCSHEVCGKSFHSEEQAEQALASLKQEALTPDRESCQTTDRRIASLEESVERLLETVNGGLRVAKVSRIHRDRGTEATAVADRLEFLQARLALAEASEDQMARARRIIPMLEELLTLYPEVNRAKSAYQGWARYYGVRRLIHSSRGCYMGRNGRLLYFLSAMPPQEVQSDSTDLCPTCFPPLAPQRKLTKDNSLVCKNSLSFHYQDAYGRARLLLTDSGLCKACFQIVRTTSTGKLRTHRVAKELS